MHIGSMSIFVFTLFFGWFLGATVNYLSETLPITRRLSKPFCIACKAEMSFANYFFWPRQCQNCGANRSWRAWLVELILILSSIWLWGNSSINLGYWTGIVLLAYFVLITVIDLEHRLILHITSLAGLFFGLWVGIKLHGIIPTLVGGATGFLLMLALYFAGFLFLRISRKLRGEDQQETEALGFGDVNLSGVIGLALGWPGILLGLVITIVLAGTASLLYLLFMLARRKYHPDMALPYGPFLAISAIILLYLRNLLF